MWRNQWSDIDTENMKYIETTGSSDNSSTTDHPCVFQESKSNLLD